MGTRFRVHDEARHEGQTLIVGHAHIAGGVELAPTDETHVNVVAGGRLRVQMPYRFESIRHREEGYRLSIEARIDDGPPADDVLDIHPRPAGNQDRWGFVSVTLPIPAGEHRLAYRIGAAVARRPRPGHTQPVVHRSHRDGIIALSANGAVDRAPSVFDA